MIYLWLLLIPYQTIAYAIHGGELAKGTDRQVRNILCAWPFGLVEYLFVHHDIKPMFSHAEYALALVAFASAFVGTNMSFDNYPLWLKGLVTYSPLGAGLLPLAYYIGNKSPLKAVASEYLSGTFYGTALALTAMVYA